MPRCCAGSLDLGPVEDVAPMTNPNNKNSHDVVPDFSEDSIISHPVRPKSAERTGQSLSVASRILR